MKKCVCFLLAVMFLCMGRMGFSAENEKEGKKLKTNSQKFSYIMGRDVVTALRKLNTKFDLDAFILGVTDRYHEKSHRLTGEQVAEVKKAISIQEKEKHKEKAERIAARNLKEGRAFLLENRKKEGVITTESGLQYEIIKEGSGPFPGENDEVVVHYRGFLINGKEFDSSYKRGGPTKVRVKEVLPGWAEALQKMQAGSHFRLYLPPHLAYGPKYSGIGGIVEPNSTIIFEVEVLKIFPAPVKQAHGSP